VFAALMCYFLFLGLIAVFFIIVHWKIYTKAGEPGWACLIPIYNMLVLARICGRPEVFGLVYAFVPCVGLIIMCFDLAAAFGKDAGFAIGLLLLGIVFFPILAFGDAEHVYSRRGRRRRNRDDDDRPRRRRPADEDEDEDDRPRRRRPVAEDEDDEDRPRRRPAAQDDRVKRRPTEDDRPRRRPSAEDEEDEPRPRRRRPDDDDY
jgi:hypothetical protein